MHTPDNHTEELAIINPLLQSMCAIQDALESEVPEREIEYNNSLYDEIRVGFLEEAPDSTYQEKLTKDSFALTFVEAKKLLVNRLHDMLQAIQESQAGIYK